MIILVTIVIVIQSIAIEGRDSISDKTIGTMNAGASTFVGQDTSFHIVDENKTTENGNTTKSNQIKNNAK